MKQKKNTIKLDIIGYEFACPKCDEHQELGAFEYTEGQPVQCKNCGIEFMYTEVNTQ